MSRYSPRARLTNSTSTATVANWFGNQFVILPTGYESIATVSGTGSSGTITFSSIPSTYTHLQIRGIARSDYATGNYLSSFYRFNSDSGSNYSSHYVISNGASASAYAWSSYGEVYGSYTTTVNALSNNYALYIIDILDYANTNKYKTIRTLNGFDNNNTGSSDFNKGIVGLSSGLWMNTNAISSIGISNSGNWTTATTFALYGIKGA